MLQWLILYVERENLSKETGTIAAKWSLFPPVKRRKLRCKLKINQMFLKIEEHGATKTFSANVLKILVYSSVLNWKVFNASKFFLKCLKYFQLISANRDGRFFRNAYDDANDARLIRCISVIKFSCKLDLKNTSFGFRRSFLFLTNYGKSLNLNWILS